MGSNPIVTANFEKGFLAPPLKSSYEYSLKEQKTKFSKQQKYFKPINLKNLKLGLVPTNLQKTVYSNLNNLILYKRKGEGSIPSHVTACWCNGST